jgi:hypothetical protein
MMVNRKSICGCSVVLVIFLLQSCDRQGASRTEAVFRTVPEIAEIAPLNPVKIKLKRTVRGEYSWDLSGDDVQRITEADARLRTYISGSSDGDALNSGGIPQ